jgi:hypothetical protein
MWRFGERRFCLLGEVVRVYYRRGGRQGRQLVFPRMHTNLSKRERVREGVRESGCVGFGEADDCGRNTHGSGVLSFSTNAHEWTRNDGGGISGSGK